MDRLSIHFDWTEFRCRGESCCGHTMVADPRLVAGLEEVRGILNSTGSRGEVKLHIDSGFRCIVHNAEVDGTSGSYHTHGMAADVRPEGCTALALAAAARRVRVFAEGGIGVYNGFVHLDVRRNGPARW